MEDKEYNLFYALNRLINNTEESVDTILAKYFLENYFKAKDFNIYAIAADCHVSRSSIRRFAENLGYQNFQNLKKNMIDNCKQLPSIDDQKYRALLTNTIVNIAEELDHRMDTDQVDVICECIRRSHNFYIVCSGASLSAVKDFQVRLAAKNKVSRIINGEEKLAYLKNILTDQDCILIISVSGISAVDLQNYFKEIGAEKILITANRIASFEEDYSKVYYMSHLDHSHNPDLYRKYGLSYLLDILVNHY